MTSRGRLALVALALAGLSVVTVRASANGRFPVANQLVVSPSDPNVVIVRATFGVVISKDAGKTWSWVCETVMGYGGKTEDPAVGLTKSALLVATQEGLSVSSDIGCTWSPLVQGIDAPAVDVVVRRNDSSKGFVLTAAGGKTDDAGQPTYLNKIFATVNDGANWAQVGGVVEPSLLVQTIEVATSDPKRIYLSGTSYGATSTDAVLLASTDNGATFARHTFPLLDNELAPYIAAVDPTDADRVYVRVDSMQGGRLVLTEDGGKTFRDLFTTSGSMAGFALSNDGSKIYVGGPDDGLYVSSRTDFKFAQTSKKQIQCLAMSGTTLLACGNDTIDFAIGASNDDGASFTPLLHIGCVQGPVTCSTGTATTTCTPEWAALKTRLGTCTASPDGGVTFPTGSDAATLDADAGGSTGGVDGGGSFDTPSSSSGGCSLGVGAVGGLGGTSFFAAGAGIVVARARRKKRRAPSRVGVGR